MAENEYPKEITVNGDTFVVTSKEHEEQARQEAKDNKVEVTDNSIDQQNSTVDKAKVDQPELKSKKERKDTAYTLEDDYSNNNTIDINDSEVSLDNYDNILKKHKPKDQSTDEFLKSLKPGSKTISIPDPYSKTGIGKVDKELKTYAGFTKSENPTLWYELDFLYKNHQKANKIKSRSIGGKEDMSDAQIVQQNQNINDTTQELTSYEPDSELKFTQTDFENVYEDMIGVDTTATDLATKEFQENLATTLDQMQKMGMVNVQELANASLKQSEQTRAGISAQTREADMLRAQGAEKVQTKEQQAELKIAEGAHMAEMTRLQGASDARNLEYQKTQGLMALEAGELESMRADRLARRNWFVRVFG